MNTSARQLIKRTSTRHALNAAAMACAPVALTHGKKNPVVAMSQNDRGDDALRETPFTDVTPAMAADWLAKHNFSGQRKIRSEKVDSLAKTMMVGRFMAGTAITFDVFGGDTHLVNGQHTLSAIVKSGMTIPLTVIVRRVNSMEDVAHDYSRHDTRMSIRTEMAALEAYALDLGIPHSIVNIASAAMRAILIGLSTPYRKDIDARSDAFIKASALRDYKDEISTYYKAIQVAPMLLSCLRLSPVFAIGIETFRYQPKEAWDFWSVIAQNEGLKKGEPRRALSDFLMLHRADGTPNQTFLKAAAHAWNAYFNGRNLQIVRPGCMKEFFLEGTPHEQGVDFRPFQEEGDEI